MEIYNTEEQQVEAIKSWWRDNGVAVLLGAVVGLGGLYGWRYYQSEKLAGQEASSEAYMLAMNALSSNGDKALADAENFVAKNDDNYASLLSLQLAKSLVESNELEKAAAQLRLVQQNKDAVLSAVATVRLARIQVELNQLDAALSELNKVNAEGFKAQVEELKGDIKQRQGDKQAAIAAYTASIAAQINPVVQMKLDNLAK